MKWLLVLIFCLSLETGHAQFMERISPISKESTELSIMLISYDLLQLSDCALTYYALPRGAVESNPIMAGIVNKPALVISMKITATLATNYFIKELYMVSPLASYIVMATLNIFYSYVFFNNVQVVANLE